MLHRPILRGLSLFALASLLSGCVLAPQGTKEERQRIDAAGRPYDRPFAQRNLPDLSAEPTWQDILHRAFLANGDLEAAYFEWQAASHRIDMAAAYPNTNLALGFEYMFSRENMKAWDRTTISAQPDPMQSLSLPVKVKQSGKVALTAARAAGKRFEAVKFDLQRRVLVSWLDYALLAEKVRIQRDNVALLRLISDTAAQRVQAGGQQQDLLKADVALRLAENELQSMEAEIPQMRAMLNALMGRRADTPLPPPKALPALRAMPADDARLLAVAVDNSPELAGLAQQVQGRKDAIELARLQYLPDINPIAAFSGSVSQSIGAMISVPTNIPMIRGAVHEARSMLHSTEAMARQTRLERGASFVAALYALRNNERQIALFEQHIYPAADRVLTTTRQAYANGSVGFIELIDSQRVLLDVRLMIAEARIGRDKRLAELEALAGIDIETLAVPPAARPTTQPAASPRTTGFQPVEVGTGKMPVLRNAHGAAQGAEVTTR